MEKRFKKDNWKEYFSYLTDQIGGKTISTRELYQIIRDTDKHFSLEVKGNGREGRITAKYVEILGSSISSIEDTDSRKLSTVTPRIYCLNDDDTTIKNKINAYYTYKVGIKEEAKPKSEEIKVEEVVKEKEDVVAVTPRKYTRTKPPKKIVENVYKILKASYSSGGGGIYLYNLKRVTGKTIEKKQLEVYMNTLKTFGVMITYNIDNDRRGEKVLRLYNIKSAILSLSKKAEEWYGMTLVKDGEFGHHLRTASPVLKVKEVKTAEKVGDKYTIFLIGAIIKKNDYKAVNIDSLCTMLRQLGKNEWKGNIQTIIDNVPELERVGESVAFVGGEENWEDFMNKYLSKKDSVLARIKIKPETLEKLGIEYRVESTISMEDFVYQINYRKDSRVDFRKLVTLYRNFSDTDCFLGSTTEELVEKIKDQIEKDNKLIEDNDLLYQFEK